MNALIDWFARNSVAANLLMIFIILLGVNACLQNLYPLVHLPFKCPKPTH